MTRRAGRCTVSFTVSFTLAELHRELAARPVLLAPMEDVSDDVFRRLCRSLGADLCVTEFVQVDCLIGDGAIARRKAALGPGGERTAIQIHGKDASRLATAARVAETAEPAFIDLNCGCAVTRVASRGAGAGWLKDPAAMVAMARQVVSSTSLPVTLKTRVGLGYEAEMPIVDLARRLEDSGIAALTLHCRTAQMGFGGRADWSYAARAQAAMTIPVIVNGDIESADDAERALCETGCTAVMVGRRAIAHPWIFREARALLDHGVHLPAPSPTERLALFRAQLEANAAKRGERNGVRVTRRHLAGYLAGLPGLAALRAELFACDSLARSLELLLRYEGQLGRAAGG